MNRWARRALAAALLLLAVHGAVWLAALWRLEAELGARRQALVDLGWQVAAGPTHWAGWPLAARLDVDGLDVKTPDGSAGWRSGTARFGIALARPLWLATTLDGPHAATLGGVEVPVQAANIALSARLIGQPVRSELVLRDLRAEGPGGVLAIAALDLHATNDLFAPAGRVALTVSATASDVALPSPVMARARGGFGPRIPALALDGSITAPLPAGPPTREDAAAWRAAGGRLQLTRLSLRWGKLDVGGSAELTLDGALQPAGSGTLRAVGVPETADALAEAGAIPGGTARAVKALAGLMARPPDNEVELALTLAGRILTLAGFPIARLPELRW